MAVFGTGDRGAGTREHLLLGLVCLSWVLGGGGLAAAAPAASPVAVVPLHFRGELVSADRSVLGQRLALGLKATKTRVISGDSVARCLGGRDSAACDAACRRNVAAKLAARYVVGGEVEAKHDNYKLRLWAADGSTGTTVAEVDRACDICGVTELANTMELAASALQLKLEAVSRRASQVRAAGASDQLAVEPQAESGGAWRRPVGWGLVAAGGSSVVLGAVLFALNGKATDCEPGDQRTERCRSERQTSAGGWASMGLGLAAVGAGAYLILTGKPVEQADVALLPQGAGLSVRGRF